MGMGSQPSAPTLDVGQSEQLLRRQLEVQREQLPLMSAAAGQAGRAEYRRNMNFGLRMLGDAGLRQRYEGAMPDEVRRRNALLEQLDAGQSAAPEYTRLQEQLQGSVGERVGMLTPEQQREAVQSARAAMSARGMATGSAGAAAELLNRDRYMQQRRAQDLNILGQSAQLAEQERGRRLGLGQDTYNFALGTNPNVLAIGAGSPYTNMSQNSMQMVGNAGGLTPIYTGGSPGTAGQNMAMFGSLMNMGGQLGGAAIQASDKRMKKDIKQVGKDGVLGLKTYEYRYKGESKDAPKRIGFMAQDVQKVMPDAVEEIDYKGKKRLAIRPAMLGQALTAALTAQQDAMFSQGYTVA